MFHPSQIWNAQWDFPSKKDLYQNVFKIHLYSTIHNHIYRHIAWDFSDKKMNVFNVTISNEHCIISDLNVRCLKCT